jgi:hypothetical protein
MVWIGYCGFVGIFAYFEDRFRPFGSHGEDCKKDDCVFMRKNKRSFSKYPRFVLERMGRDC